MLVKINGEDRVIRAQTLELLVAEEGFEPTDVATALDGEFVPREERGSALLRAGARVEILTPMQGG
ncbi:sulfur carrier protein ThiS [Roseibium litorale]|uniref:Sulfur carrier protein ThiS n=1 Tax=Roseibium litorale TaxID=2803841 RepID=A0ABR9CPJ2_9HYPH|nr:sulfur carrier protein ThiS [Roseibium litorale]MBD8892181.1 sulfur carrier protein ThiS [Roseibium litorale]